MTASRSTHWDSVYGSKAENAVSWFQASPQPSMGIIESLDLPAQPRVVDVGGGASRLVDALTATSRHRVSVLDVSAAGLRHAQRRLGTRAGDVEWVVADVTRWEPTDRFDVWHDRAVFHFLVDGGDRRRYREVLARAVAPGGFAVVATFALDGPDQCSGLPVVRYDASGLHAQLAADWTMVEWRGHVHRTPWGSEQAFTWLVLQRPPAARATP